MSGDNNGKIEISDGIEVSATVLTLEDFVSN